MCTNERFCRLFPNPNCGNCRFTCEDESPAWGADCPDWQPGRGATPSTPNVCEGAYENPNEFPLCLPEECTQCGRNPFRQ